MELRPEVTSPSNTKPQLSEAERQLAVAIIHSPYLGDGLNQLVKVEKVIEPELQQETAR